MHASEAVKSKMGSDLHQIKNEISLFDDIKAESKVVKKNIMKKTTTPNKVLKKG